MRNAVTAIIDKYGIDRIHYSVIIFGSTVTRRVTFDDQFPEKNALNRIVGRSPRVVGEPNLLAALEEAKSLYELQSVRSNARKVLVVILDAPSASNATAVRQAVTDLDNKDVLVIGVGMGSSANENDLIGITKDDRHLINAPLNKSPREVAQEIIEAIFYGINSTYLCFIIFLCFPLLFLSFVFYYLSRGKNVISIGISDFFYHFSSKATKKLACKVCSMRETQFTVNSFSLVHILIGKIIWD